MINDEFRCLIGEKIQSLEKEKRRLQIIYESEKLAQLEKQQETLNQMMDYPDTYAFYRISREIGKEEFEYLVNFYIADVEQKIARLNQEIDKFSEYYDDKNFFKEVAAYRIFQMFDNDDSYGLRKCISIIESEKDKNFYGTMNDIQDKVQEKIHGFPDIVDLSSYDYEGLKKIILQEYPEFKNFKSKFDNKVISFSENIARLTKGDRLLPSSEDIRSLLEERKKYEEKLAQYKNLDWSNEKDRSLFIHDVFVSKHYSTSASLPFYAFYDLDKFDKLLALSAKVDKAEDKKSLCDAVFMYKAQLNDKVEYNKREELLEKHGKDYDRFMNIYNILHDIPTCFQFVRYRFTQKGIYRCLGLNYQFNDKSIKTVLGTDIDPKFINEIQVKIDKLIDETEISSLVDQYDKLSKKRFVINRKAKLAALKKELSAKVEDKVRTVEKKFRDEYVKEGYQLFTKLPFLKHYDRIVVEKPTSIEEDHNNLFNGSLVGIRNTYPYFESFHNEKFESNMKELREKISDMIKDNISEEEMLSLCKLTGDELSQITEKNSFYKMKTFREIIVQYDSLNAKSFVDNKEENQKLGR